MVGTGLVLIYLPLGVIFLYFGFSLFAADIITIIGTRGGGNLSGLGIILGGLMIVLSRFLLLGFVSGVLLLKRNPEGRTSVIKFLTIVTFLLILGCGYSVWGMVLIATFNIASILFLKRPQVQEQFIGTLEFTPKEKRIFILSIAVMLGIALFKTFQSGIQASVEWNKKIAVEEEHQAKIRKYYQREDEKILKEFDNKKIVSVRFSFDFADDRESERKAKTSDEAPRKALNIQFVRDHIVDPIGPTDMPSFRIEENTIDYSAEITRAGYEKLRKNKYARWISLKK